MKTSKIFKIVLAGYFFLFLSFGILAQEPPNPPDNHGGNTDAPAFGTAPVSGVVSLLLALGAGYGGKESI